MELEEGEARGAGTPGRGALVIGKRISHFTIVEQLGQGGMGVVYKAVDERLQRPVALKFLPSNRTHDRESRERLLREARLASTLEHQNICAIHEVGETEDGRVFICMSCYEGQPLSEALRHGPLPVGEALRLVIQLVDGLAHAHAQGVIHRDVKPANLMLTSSGTVKIMDFGLARAEGQEHLTRKGSAVGTVAYMAPEQLLGEPADARSDVWSVGVVLFQMLTGRLPFEGEYEAAVVYSIVNEKPPTPRAIQPAVPVELAKTVLRCLAHRPADRFETMNELLVVLREIRHQIPAAMKPPQVSPGALTARSRARHKKTWILSTAAVVLAAAALFTIPAVRDAVAGRTPPPPLPEVRSVAVLPFHLSSEDTASRALADGFRVFLTERLVLAEEGLPRNWTIPAAQVRDQKIVSREEARRQCNVNLVLAGSFSLEGTAAVLKLEIRDAGSGTVLRQGELRDHLSSLTTFQRGLVDLGMRLLELAPGPGVMDRLTAGETALPGAFRKYVQGLGILERRTEAGRVEMGLDLFQKAVDTDPDYADGWTGVATACYLRSRQDPGAKARWMAEAEAAARRSLQLSERASSRRLLAQLVEASGNPEAAIAEYREAIRTFPGYFDAECDLAWICFDLGRMKEAEEHFQSASRLRPDYWLPQNYLGTLYQSLARYTEAERAFAHAIRLAPENVTPYSNLAAVYFKEGRSDKVRETIERAVPLHPNGVLLANWGTFNFYSHNYLDAVGMYERAIVAGDNPFDYVMWGNLAECYRQLPGQQDRAQHAFKKAIELGERALAETPGDPDARSRLALYRAMTGRMDRALKDAQTARKQAPKSIDVLVRAIRVYELAGRREAVLQSVRELLDRAQSLKDLEKDPDLVDLRSDPRYAALAAHPE